MKLKKHLLEDISEAKKSIKKDEGLLKEMKKQSPKARMDESLGMRKGKESEKKESYAARRHESEGMEHHEMAMHHLKKAHDHLKKHAAKKK